MRRFIALILSFMFMVCSCGSCFADSTDIIYDILNKPTSSSTGEDIIYGILGKQKSEVKIKVLNENTISDELESENKIETNTKKKTSSVSNVDKNAYIKGLDISKWNGDIDWDAVEKAGIKFVVIRAGYGTTVDYKFEKNIQQAIDHHMIIGVYWFSYAYTDNMAIREAHKCAETISKYKKNITLPVFYDFEYDSVNYAARQGVTISKRSASSFADKFCSTIKKQGYNAGIYTNIDYSNRYFTHDVLDKYHTWIAQWRSPCTYKYDYIIWQRTDKYYIGNKKFDLDYFYFNRYKGDK